MLHAEVVMRGSSVTVASMMVLAACSRPAATLDAAVPREGGLPTDGVFGPHASMDGSVRADSSTDGRLPGAASSLDAASADRDAASADRDAASPAGDAGGPGEMHAGLDAAIALPDGGLGEAGIFADAGRDAAVAGDPDAGREPPPRMDCAGKPGAPGDSTRMYDGRAYHVHIPANVHPNTAVPVLFAVHGQGSNGADMRTGSAFDLLADREGFVAIFPDGAQSGSSWNVGRGACQPGGLVSSSYDDFAYFDHMLDDVEQDQCIDRDRVLVTGFSMGGYFSHHIGCQRVGDFVRAIAPHSGGTYAGDCPGAPLPVMVLHGDADPLIPFSCAERARDLWVERNGCSAEFDTVDIVGGHCEWHRDCPESGQVTLCAFDGLDHNWGFPPDYEYSTLLIWSFFSSYL